ncbi:hypothetical protein PHYSODRAFT_295229 [Phytophthora sojae]|uniref:Uncharacterized protein n=1 Tax=Phytophthora sojae (strain P6497) TaxID=1094619 RepID=G4YQQ5_PHYSP|nr:hypothetical protein PHYSODRAFT_295229 [Phytophthora sojae]EGZ30426.1 hypothetical protein PHYSODRAFT_295229 [Phytophthora sojae]|eukprot:XP_009517701.1 hypothetical protein PHYSODRAFT_295229 [Phytophthora sojae]
MAGMSKRERERATSFEAQSASKKQCTNGMEDMRHLSTFLYCLTLLTFRVMGLKRTTRRQNLMKDGDRTNNKPVLASVEGMNFLHRLPVVVVMIAVKDAMRENPMAKTLNATIRLRLVWISRHLYNATHLLRLHLVDADAPETVAELHKTFKANFDEKPQYVNSVLLTATVFNAERISDDALPNMALSSKSSIARVRNSTWTRRPSW